MALGRDWRRELGWAREMVVVGGDFNGELPPAPGGWQDGEEEGLPFVVGRWGTGRPNENGARLMEEAANQNLCAAASLQRKAVREKWTFEGRFAGDIDQRRREYDHFLLSFGSKDWLEKIFVERYTLHKSDHWPVVMDLSLRPPEPRKEVLDAQLTRVLRRKEVGERVQESLGNRFGPLEDLEVEDEAWKETVEVVLEEGRKAIREESGEERRKKPWIGEQTMGLIRERAKLRKILAEKEDVVEEME